MDVWTDGRPLVFYKLILWAFGSGELKNKQTFASLSVWTLECIPETYQDDVLLLLSWFVRHLLIYIPQTVPNGLYTTTLCLFDGSRYPENNCILCNLFLFKCLTPHEWWFVQTTEEIKSRKWKDKWAVTWQNKQSECVPSEDSDQPGHLPSLIRVFTVRSIGS